MNKPSLRKKMLHSIKNLTVARKKEAALNAVEQLKRILPSRGLVASYFPINLTELDISPLNIWLASQKRLCLPKVEPGGLTFYCVTSLSDCCQQGTLNLIEPNTDLCTKTCMNQVSLLLVPGVAFDSKNNRLGRGGGYYDRVIANHPNLPTLSVAFSEQKVLQPLQAEPHDQKVDRILFF